MTKVENVSMDYSPGGLPWRKNNGDVPIKKMFRPCPGIDV